MRVAKRENAHRAKMSHAFMHGLGYIFVGPLQPRNAVVVGMKPPHDADHNSLHWVEAPQGARILMRWDKVNNMWEHPHNPAAGNRLGWSPEYLASWGWKHKLPLESKKN